MPIRPFSVIFFFTVQMFNEYVQTNQSNTRDRKNVRYKNKLFFSASLFVGPHDKNFLVRST